MSLGTVYRLRYYWQNVSAALYKTHFHMHIGFHHDDVNLKPGVHPCRQSCLRTHGSSKRSLTWRGQEPWRSRPSHFDGRASRFAQELPLNAPSVK